MSPLFTVLVVGKEYYTIKLTKCTVSQRQIYISTQKPRYLGEQLDNIEDSVLDNI